LRFQNTDTPTEKHQLVAVESTAAILALKPENNKLPSNIRGELSHKIVDAAEGIWTEYSNRFNEIKDAPSHMFIVAPLRMTATEKTEWLEKCITENRSTVPV
jgi:hypothetical protein